MNVVDICCLQKDDKQPLLMPPAHHNKVSPHPDDETPEFKIDVSLIVSCKIALSVFFHFIRVTDSHTLKLLNSFWCKII